MTQRFSIKLKYYENLVLEKNKFQNNLAPWEMTKHLRGEFNALIYYIFICMSNCGD